MASRARPPSRSPQRRPDAVRRRAAPADRRRWRRRRRAGPPPRAPQGRRLPRASRRSSPRPRSADAALARIRALLRDRTGRATTAGYGPRFLHSTGQLHKGGAADRLVPPADRGPPGRPADPRLAVHLRPAHRRPGGRRLRAPSSRTTCRSCASTSAPTWIAGLAALERALAAALDHDTRRVDPRCASGSSVSAGWGPTWSAASSATATRSSSTTGRRRRPRRSRPRARAPTASFSIEELVAALREAARRLGHGPGRRRDRGPDRRAARAPRAGRHDHRRRQHQLPRRHPPPRDARGEGHPLRRRRDVGRHLGPPGRATA